MNKPAKVDVYSVERYCAKCRKVIKPGTEVFVIRVKHQAKRGKHKSVLCSEKCLNEFEENRKGRK